MKRHLLLAPPIAALLACSGSAVTLQPGEWESSVQFSAIDMPGAPPEATAAIRTMMGQPQTRRDCITPEQAANPMGRMMTPSGTDANACQFSENTFSGGAIRVRGTCTDPQRGTMTMSWQGSYTATSMEANVTSDMQAPPGTAGPQSIHMTGRMTGRRVGECPARPAP